MSEELPKGWSPVDIGDVCDLINGKAFKPGDWTTEGLPIVRIQNLNKPDAPFNHFEGEVADKFIIDNGTLLFAWSGTPGTSFGAHVWNGGKAVLNQHIFKVLVPADIDKSFFRFAINQKLDELIGKAHGGVGLRHVTKGKFEKTGIALPPLNEQHRIVDKIDALMARSGAAKQALDAIPALLDEYRQSILKAAFNGDLTKNWRAQNPDIEPAADLLARIRTERRQRWEETERAKMCAKGKEPKNDKWKEKYKEPIEFDYRPSLDLPEGWSWLSFDAIRLSAQNGLSKRNATSGSPRPVLRLADIKNDKISPDHKREILLSEDEAEKYRLAYGDIVCIRVNGSTELVGRMLTFIEKGYWAFCDHFIRFKIPDHHVRSDYLSNYFNSPLVRKHIGLSFVSTAGQKTINQNTLAKIGVPVPPLAEQDMILDLLRRSDLLEQSIITGVSNSRFSLQTLNQSILAKAFRGELVPQDPDDEPASVLLDRIKEQRAAMAAKPKARRGKKQSSAI